MFCSSCYILYSIASCSDTAVKSLDFNDALLVEARRHFQIANPSQKETWESKYKVVYFNSMFIVFVLSLMLTIAPKFLMSERVVDVKQYIPPIIGAFRQPIVRETRKKEVHGDIVYKTSG